MIAASTIYVYIVPLFGAVGKTSSYWLVCFSSFCHVEIFAPSAWLLNRQYEVTPDLQNVDLPVIMELHTTTQELPHTRGSHHDKYTLCWAGCPYHKLHNLQLFVFRGQIFCRNTSYTGLQRDIEIMYFFRSVQRDHELRLICSQEIRIIRQIASVGSDYKGLSGPNL